MRILVFISLLILTFTAPADAAITAIWAGRANYQPYTWTGNGGDSNWSNGANWCGIYLDGVCQGQSVGPSATDIAYFSNACTSNCNPTLDVPVNIKGLDLAVTYSGTIDQGANTITLGSSGLVQYNGTFIGGSANVTSSGLMTLSGGTFTAPSAILAANGGFTLAGGTFKDNGGTFNTTTYSQTGGTYTATTGTLTATTGFTLAAGSTFNSGTGTVKFSWSGSGNFTPSNAAGSTFYNLQFISQVAGANFSTVNAVPFSGTATLNAVAATATLNGADPNQAMLRPTAGSTLKIIGYGFTSSGSNSISPLGNFTLDATGASPAVSPGLNVWNSHTMTALGNPTLRSVSSHSSLTLNVNGNFSVSGTFGTANQMGGTSQISMIGGGSLGLFSNTGVTVVINAPGSTVSLSKNATWMNASGSALRIVAGTLKMNGFNLSVAGTITIDSGATLTVGTGALSYGTLVNNGTLN